MQGASVGYELVGDSTPNQEGVEVIITSSEPSMRAQRLSKWRARDVKKDFAAMGFIVVLLWISILPMRKSQERALRGLVCLALAAGAAILVGWTVKRSVSSDSAHEPTHEPYPADAPQEEL